ncbi:MAG: hypothetical protein NT001_05905 [Candidatus Woesearchaeota archaeon]|nr:hypothetical protein [Candidatus Woesearchaeota archaeon]
MQKENAQKDTQKMARLRIDWDKHTRNMQEAYKPVKSILEEKLAKIKFDTGIIRTITYEQYPPRIQLDFFTHGHLQEKEYLKNLQRIAEIIGAVAEEYHLAAYRGNYNPPDAKGRIRLVFNKEFDHDFIIEPMGDPYKVNHEH